MININTARQLLVRTPFLIGRVDKKNIKILEFRWGGEDGNIHSTKSVIKRLDLKISGEEVKQLESTAIQIINNEIDKIFECRNCNTDIRKSGVYKFTTGFQRAEVFISGYGEITRVKDAIFQKENYSSRKIIKYSCLRCGKEFDQEDPVTLFLENQMCQDTIITYMMRFNNVSPDDFKEIKRINNGPFSVFEEIDSNEEG